MRTATPVTRSIAAAVLGLLLALRLLGSTGYMPAIEHGSVRIVVCPGADSNAPLALGTMHHHGHAKHDHNDCPYAAAGALGAVGAEYAPLLAVLVIGIALLLGRSFLFIERNAARERPPSRGPPIPA